MNGIFMHTFEFYDNSKSLLTMKNFFNFCLVAFLMIPTITDAQILNRIRRAAEQGVSRAVENQVERQVEKATQRQLEKAFENLYGPDTTSSTGAYDFSKIIKGIKTNVPTESSYDFVGFAEMEITGMDEQGKAIDPTRIKIFLNDGREYSGMEFSPAKSGRSANAEHTLMIFDMKNNASIILMDTEDGKASMAYGLDFQKIAEMGEEELEESEASNDDLNFVKTGNTKTVLGYLCEEYLMDWEEGSASYWITQAPIEGVGSFWGKNSPFINQKMKDKNYEKFSQFPQGNILEINFKSKFDPSETNMTLVEIDESAAVSFAMADYPSVFQGAE